MYTVSHYELLCLVTVMLVLTPRISHKTGTKRTQAKTSEEEKKAEGNCYLLLLTI